MTTYVTFGSGHAHRINSHTVDCNCVAAIESDTWEEGRRKAFEYFGDKFCFEYFNEKPDMKFFPRGVIWIDGDKPAEDYRG